MPGKSKRSATLSHLSAAGEARMVDVGPKAVTARRAVAEAEVRLNAPAWRALTTGSAPKGDVLAVARIAGIQAAKKTSELIPLCHPLGLTRVGVHLSLENRRRVVRIRAEAECEAKTGVEMEALTAAAVAALAVYDMLKGLDRSIVLGPIFLVEKSGGIKGDWRRTPTPPKMRRGARKRLDIP